MSFFLISIRVYGVFFVGIRVLVFERIFENEEGKIVF